MPSAIETRLEGLREVAPWRSFFWSDILWCNSWPLKPCGAKLPQAVALGSATTWREMNTLWTRPGQCCKARNVKTCGKNHCGTNNPQIGQTTTVQPNGKSSYCAKCAENDKDTFLAGMLFLGIHDMIMPTPPVMKGRHKVLMLVRQTFWWHRSVCRLGWWWWHWRVGGRWGVTLVSWEASRWHFPETGADPASFWSRSQKSFWNHRLGWWLAVVWSTFLFLLIVAQLNCVLFLFRWKTGVNLW